METKKIMSEVNKIEMVKEKKEVIEESSPNPKVIINKKGEGQGCFKRLWGDLKYGVKEGGKVPLYPPKVDKFNNNIYVRIFKIIGASCLGIAWRIDIYQHFMIKTVVSFFGLLFFVYYAFLIICMVVYYIKLMIKGELNVRNSPTNIPASIAKQLWAGLKRAGIVGGFTLGGLTSGTVIDHYLEKANRDPICGKYAGYVLEKTLDQFGVPKKDNVKNAIEQVKSLNQTELKEFNNVLDDLNKDQNL